jgi:hypothetical protein
MLFRKGLHLNNWKLPGYHSKLISFQIKSRAQLKNYTNNDEFKEENSANPTFPIYIYYIFIIYFLIIIADLDVPKIPQ